MERIWMKKRGTWGDPVRFPLVEGKLNLRRIAEFWKLDPSAICVGPDVLDLDAEGCSVETISQIREFASSTNSGDGRSKETAFIVDGAPAPAPAQDKDPRSKRQKLVVVDKSKDWAASVLTPFNHENILDSEKLKNALAEPLPLKIPISPELYKELDPQIAEHFVSSYEYEADFISAHINMFMGEELGGGSESLQQSSWDVIFANFWRKLLSLTKTTMISINRNVTDPSGASTARVRPDLLLWSVRRLVVKFEEKKGSLQEAYDLINKLAFLPRHFFGPVEWIIGVGLAGGEMCVWALKPGHNADCLYGPVEMKYFQTKYDCILVSVNLLRIALTLKSVFSNLAFMPVPYMTLPPLTYGKQDSLTRTIQIIWPKVIKIIQPWSMHVQEGFTTWEYVNTAYSLEIPQLIKGQCSLRRKDKYQVTLQEVGYEEQIISEFAMRQAIKDVLHALMALHGAGLVHRDVRWKNILKSASGLWMLIDLETVWKSGEQPTCSLRVWDENTLDGGTHFTEKSDLYLVGKLMEKLPNSGHVLRRRLLNHRYDCAEDALEDDWLHQQ